MTTTQLTVAQQREREIKSLLNQATPKMLDVLPKTSDLRPEKIIRLALMDVSQNSYLRTCDPMTILTSVIHAAALGLQIGPFLGEAYLVPFKGKCQLIPGYRGLVRLAHQGLAVASVQARLVYEGDAFEVRYGTTPEIVHVPDLKGDRSDEKIVAGYMVAKLRSGDTHFEVMTRDEVEKRRKNSQAGESKEGPWVNWYPEQFKKTVVRNGVKLLPASSDVESFERLNAAIELDNRFDTGKMTAPSPILDDEQAMRDAMAQRTQEQVTNLRDKINASRPKTVEPTEIMSDEENLELDRKLVEAEERNRDA